MMCKLKLLCMFCVILVVSSFIGVKCSLSQKSEADFTSKEEHYSFESYVGSSPLDKEVAVGGKNFNLKAKENFGANEDELWTELVVESGNERYDFRVARRGPTSSQINQFDVGQTYELNASGPFVLKAQLLSKDDGSGQVKTAILPDEGIPSCLGNTMKLKLRYTSTSYLICEGGNKTDVLVKFEHIANYNGRLDIPGYRVYLKNEKWKMLDGFEEVGGFRASSFIDAKTIEHKILPFDLKMERVRRRTYGDYEDISSVWRIDAIR